MMAGGSMRLLVALLLAPLALTGQADGVSSPNHPPAAPQYRPEDLCSVEGQVVNSETGGPVNKASLALFPMAPGSRLRRAAHTWTPSSSSRSKTKASP